MASPRVVIIGNGANAQVLGEVLKLTGINPEFHVQYEDAIGECSGLVLGMQDNARRQAWVRFTGPEPYAPVIHPGAVVMTDRIGRAPQIMAGAIVHPFTEIGDFVVVNTGAQIDHHCTIGDFAVIAPGAVLTGWVKVRERAFIGANATILPTLTIGENAIVGAGSVVTKDVPDNAVVAGNPARLLRMKREDE